MARKHNLNGQKFGRLFVLRESYKTYSSCRRFPGWLCRCDCGEELFVRGWNLLNGRTVSCGCLRAEATSERNTRHGRAKRGQQDNRYGVWTAMIQRCTDEGSPYYKYYGGRGITVCDRWRVGEGSKAGVELFIEDVGERPSARHSIDRIDNDGDYEPGNVRWATAKEQAANRRPRAVSRSEAAA